jgi:hypothetical protein
MNKHKYPQPNKHGVYLPEQCESLAFEKSDHIKARIFVLETASNEWRATAAVRLPQSCAGGYPSILRGPTHKSRMDAVAYAVGWIEHYCSESLLHHNDSTSKEAVNAVVKWSRSLYQLRLF